MELITKHYAKFRYINERHHKNKFRERVLEISTTNPFDLEVPAKTCYKIELFDIISTKINYNGKEIVLHSQPQEVAFYCVGTPVSLDEVNRRCGKSSIIYDELTRFPNMFIGAYEDVTGNIRSVMKQENLLSPDELHYKRIEDEND